MNLHIAEGAELVFSSNPQDYLPAVHSTWEGLECYNYSPLIYAYECENVALSGKGKLIAKLDIWREWYARPKPHMDALVELYYMAHKNVPVQQRDMTQGSANLTPTLERKLTPIENIVVSNVRAKSASYVCSVNANADLPVRNLTLENIKVDSVSGKALATENVVKFQFN